VCQSLSEITETLTEAAQVMNDLDDLNTVEDHIVEQEAIAKELEGQRATIVSLLQRGRDLQHNPSAPAFLAERVHHLDVLWSQTNDMVNEKLRKLKGLDCIIIISITN